MKKKLSAPAGPSDIRQKNEVRMAAAAKAAGYEPRFAVRRLSYGTFVSPQRRYFFMETPKAACTAFKHLIAQVEGIRFDPRAARPTFRETRMEMFIHQRQLFDMPTLLDLPAAEMAAAANGTDGWFSFAMVRNPFSRLVSLYQNKIRFGEPNYRDLAAKFGNPQSFGGARGAFAAFTKWLEEDAARLKRDVHFRPQGDLLLQRLIRYYEVFHVENPQAALRAFSKHIGRDLTLPVLNSSPVHSWRSFYDAETARRVAALYAADFEAFGYDPQDWRPAANARQLQETPTETALYEEIKARNEVIAWLYELLGVK